MSLKMKILTKGIAVKIRRGGNIDEILSSYIKLTDEEKNILLGYFTIENQRN